MPIFGEKCTRCGNRRTHHTYEGVPMCEACEAEQKAQVKASSEARRSCLIDSATMEKEVVLGLVLDRCPTCGGVWLDGGELEVLRTALAEGFAKDFARAMVLPM